MEKTTYSATYRMLHWAIAICMTILLITIFLRLTWMNKNNMADIMEGYFAKTPNQLSREDLVTLAKQIRKPMWNWHLYMGYALTGLFTVRFLLPLFGRMQFANPFNRGISLKTRFRYWVYAVFYLCIIVSLSTGLLMEFGPEQFEKQLESIHVLSLYYLIPFLILHLGGVIYAEFTSQPGIVSAIVRGKRPKPEA